VSALDDGLLGEGLEEDRDKLEEWPAGLRLHGLAWKDCDDEELRSNMHTGRIYI
jgi:hypothetical protein